MTAVDDLRRGWKLPGDSVPLVFSNHAVERFAELVRPTLDVDAVRSELSRLLGTARVASTAPDWFDSVQTAAAYLMLDGGNIVLPLQMSKDESLVAVTTIFRGQVPTGRNDRLHANHARRRADKAAKRKGLGRVSQPSEGPSAEEWEDRGE